MLFCCRGSSPCQVCWNIIKRLLLQHSRRRQSDGYDCQCQLPIIVSILSSHPVIFCGRLKSYTIVLFKNIICSRHIIEIKKIRTFEHLRNDTAAFKNRYLAQRIQTKGPAYRVLKLLLLKTREIERGALNDVVHAYTRPWSIRHSTK